jgi:hypothetical protein
MQYSIGYKLYLLSSQIIHIPRTHRHKNIIKKASSQLSGVQGWVFFAGKALKKTPPHILPTAIPIDPPKTHK